MAQTEAVGILSILLGVQNIYQAHITCNLIKYLHAPGEPYNYVNQFRIKIEIYDALKLTRMHVFACIQLWCVMGMHPTTADLHI